MKILITGGAGFIGSHLAEKLLKRGDTIYVLDDLSTGRIENISHLKDNKNFNYTIGTILNMDLLDSLIKKVDIIYHLAAAVGVKYVIENPIKSLKININGTENILELANKEKKKVFIASTSEIYGKNENIPFNESNDRILGPTTINRWSYSCSKAIDEFLALAYWKKEKFPVVIGRLFNTIGPRQTGIYGMVVPRFINSALSNKPITVYGNGTQTRCFTCIHDVTDALISLMETPKAEGEVFNIGSEEEIQIKDLAKKIKQLTKSNSEIIYVPYDKAYEEGFEDMERRVPDLTKIKKIINYHPRYNLDSSLKEIIKFYKK